MMLQAKERTDVDDCLSLQVLENKRKFRKKREK
jgi:hypothetical protein